MAGVGTNGQGNSEAGTGAEVEAGEPESKQAEPRSQAQEIKLPRKVLKPWGWEIIWAQANSYVGKILHIEAGKRLSLQYHEKKEETIYVLSGEMQLDVEMESLKVTKCMKSGETYHIKPGTIHRMTGITECEVLEASTPELNDVIRIEDDYHRLKE